ncbi:MAG: hypothetical protein KDA24_21640 [Deltaproteobacteria bacterium]|nr:hypothetical protein [Deltaproteobacteria bacterium]
MSETSETHDGIVLWYRPEKGQGAVKADSGRHFRFDRSEGVHDISKGLRVRVQVNRDTTPPETIVVPIPGGRREFGQVEDPKPKPKPKAPKKRRRTATTTTRSSRPAQSPGGGRRSTKKVAAPKKRLPNGAFQVGTTVLHTQHGQGFVVLSTPSVARVRFMPSGEERQVRVRDLSSLEGSK